MNKSNLFKNAWAIAKQGQKEFGGKAKEYFAEALKMAYKGITLKQAEIEIPEWIVRKNVGNVYVVEKSVLSVKRETEKALLIHASGKFGDFDFWTPKSVLKTTNVEDYAQANITVENAFDKAMSNHIDLVEQAKALGIKGVSDRWKSATLRKKIKEAQAA
ncbi:hypothetical protein K2V61_12640 [Staphylococcus simulans]|uniref:hypothetical protein n=1 Tax=Staphylococcus simulans TaxID=1286 RepID=UPI001E4291CD|nr:hypothetical protein [Staphylococcus simulans]MCD8916387.1 hypothetical protein [Staphylococcus simulans]